MADNAILATNYVFFAYGCYIFTLFRLQILLGTSMPIQDAYSILGTPFGSELMIKQIIRIICASVFFSISAIPFILIRDKDPKKVGGIYVLELVILILPLMFCSFCMMTVYDKLVYAINDKFGFND